MLVILPLVAALCLPALRLVFARPRFLEPAEKGRPVSRISVIVPARDEQETIATLLRSLKSQNPAPTEIIVVDDGSSDLTAEISRELGAKVISPPPLPDGWKGKPWACQHGASVASGDHFLFLDADTVMEPRGFANLQGCADPNSGAISICPYHQVDRAYEQLSSFFNLTMVTGINAFGTKSGNPALFGQCLLISRSAYEAVGGHNSVAGRILENFHLSKSLEKKGIPVASFLGRGTIAMRMFPAGFTLLWTGWKKGFAHGAKGVSPRPLALTSLWITGAMIITIAAIIAFFPMAGIPFRILTAIVYVIYALQCLRAFRLIGSFSPLTAILFPIPLIFYQILFFYSILDRKLGRKTKWKGRDVD